MRSVGMNTHVQASKGLAEVNHHDRVDLKEVRNEAQFDDGQGMYVEDESRTNEDVNSIRPAELVQSNGALHGPHQQPQGSAVQWESFLPVRSLKVLLVENDDSTRHVVSALLRNCSYEVTAVANGLEAWKLLIDLNKQIDLVLTEVAMPYLSGIGLLSKIKNHVTRKNIPVIMMSSDDSMGIVFNCLSRGAVDFLVKPIRKNELRNLWQHVWRKCHSQSSGSGSGSESGIQDHKSTKSRSVEESDDDSDNSGEDDGVSTELNAKGGSDNGSGTQSSWPKRVVEVDSSQANILWDQVSNSHDITSAQVARPETSKLEIIEMGKDLKIGVPKSSSFEVEDTDKNKNDKFCESNMKKAGEKLDIGMQLGCENGAPRIEPVGATKTSNSHKETPKSKHLLKNINIEDKSLYYSKESPALELSLKRTRDVDDADVSTQGRNILRHSGLSDFSRYNPVSDANQAPAGNVDSCSPPDISSEAAKPNNNSNGTPNNRSNGSDDMGSTTNNAFTTKPDEKQPPNSSTTVAVNRHTPPLQPLLPRASEGDPVKTTVGPPKAVQQQVQVRHHHHHYHHHHHHVHKLQQQKIVDSDDGSLRNMVSNILTVSAGGNGGNYGSGSGSNNNKSNVENGGKVENENGVGKTFNGGDGSGSGSGVDQERLARREAALNKFRQKRKERCFEKKVRYQSKKKLAEQRPRVRGQFVRQAVNNEDADS